MTRILAVDDSNSIREMVVFILKDAGFDVDEAQDGQQALQSAQKTQYDLILSDVNMPNMGGIELVQQLRQLSSYRFTPILMITTESTKEKKLEGKKAGATGWIVKPFQPEHLVATVKRVID
ncbi:response regulator [Pleionea mediterranea]|jgi:two-component system chemotaxis response regulator CheY|uniref:Two-component system chemotaxis response regulator CheY n=1 Tax=Pleionea mediterranea TaxID=523701 RepID=A0A316FKC0_9GAMM|nr:response regulator [Pleionea mediterranea]PWK49154.1 two-component system chemotaxis response regulator CheY [Pleionea mediterranea]